MDQKIFRPTQIQELTSIVQHIAPEKIFLVRANKSFHTSGASSFMNQFIEGGAYTSFSDFDPNPQLDDLKKGIALFQQGNFEFIIAIGGGSVLDMAKLISVFSHHPTPIEDVVLGKASLGTGNIPILAIPTTAGTGAEATQFAVLYMQKQKYSVASSSMLPAYIYLSPEFSHSADAYLTACTGLDAFCQAIESMWSVNATAESESYALTSIEKIWHNLHRAVNENNVEAKSEMLEASFLAGKAINITKTTAPHALSYAFTSYYGIPHGHAVALSLPFFLNYNYQLTDADCMDSRGAKQVQDRIKKIVSLLNTSLEEAYPTLVTFFSSLGITICIPDLIKDFKPGLISDNVNTERLSNNPRRVSTQTIALFLNSLS